MCYCLITPAMQDLLYTNILGGFFNQMLFLRTKYYYQIYVLICLN